MKTSLPADLESYRKAAWGRDSFMRTQVSGEPLAAETPPAFVLEGILFDDRNPAAVINGRVVRGGDMLNGARIVQIEKRNVTLNKDGSSIVLTLKKDEI